MAGAAEEKSRGLKFAERQLLRHGWEQGKGLGREENGISEAIKVKVKCDKGGVGHHQGEQFTFQWWDHVFNKASANLVVESGQDGVKVKKVVGEGDEGMISNKKPRKAELAKAKLYGRFVKSTTLWSAEEKPSTSEDDSESEDEDKRLDLSSTTKLSDQDLMKVCGGRTAHKGARHGLTMSAKLARLEQQEQEFLAKYAKKNQPTETLSRETASQSPVEEEAEREGNEGKKCKKKKKRSKEKLEKTVGEDEEVAMHPETNEGPVIEKAKKKRSKEKTEAVVEGQPDAFNSTKKEGKRKKHSNVKKSLGTEEGNCHLDSEVTEDDGMEGIKTDVTDEQGEGTMVPELINGDIIPKKKKKRSTNTVEVSVAEAGECNHGEESNDAETIPKKKNASDIPEYTQEEDKMEEGHRPKKKKKYKEREVENVESGGQDETMRVKKKKKKKIQEPVQN